MTPLLLYGSAESGLHDTGPGHPERPARMAAVERGISEARIEDLIERRSGRSARRADLERVHDPRYLDSLEDFIAAGGGDLDPDTPVSAGSWDAALVAAGCGPLAVEALDRGEAAAAFVAVRPPGHHATRSRAMGFCLINNIAVTAAALADRGERVLIVDWDVHHGNGTQDAFWDDPRVMYVSTHEWPAYPGTGRPQDIGGEGARGLTMNIPLPPGATGDVVLEALAEVVEPEVARFSPSWVLVSAGFDAHRDDPLAGLAWSAGDYTELTTAVAGWAPSPGRLIAFLEGGYDLGALSRSCAATVATMAGRPYLPEPLTTGGPGRDIVAAVGLSRRRSREEWM